MLIDGAPVLFDAIEFDPTIATGDVFYDLAFLLMDLIERGLTPAANIVLNRYLAETRRDDDLDALAALPLFMSVRAAIRAKVTAARPQARRRDRASAQSYFALAQRLIAPPRAAAGRGRRPVGHRQVAAGARAGARSLPPRPARSGCAAMSSARRCSASPKPSGCRQRPMRPR